MVSGEQSDKDEEARRVRITLFESSSGLPLASGWCYARGGPALPTEKNI